MSETQKRYRAFISYSQQDSAWGKRLHGWLESYRVPVGVMADIVPSRRLGRFFRDEEEMSAAANIAESVREAIDAAESLIVVCSPRSAQSTWVNAEILHFRRTRRGGQVFAFIIDGVPNSGDAATECFPPALRAASDPENPDALPIEPLGLDIRKDGKDRACARLAAGLLDVDFDDLWQRERRRTETRQRALIGGLGALSLIFATLTVTAVVFAKQSERRAAILSIEAARTELLEGHTDAALLVLLEAAKEFSARETPDALLIAFDEALQRATAETIYPLPQDARVFDAPRGVFIVDPGAKTVSLLTASASPRIVARLDTVPIFIGQTSDQALITVGSDFRIERRIGDVTQALGAFAPQAASLDPDDPYEGRIKNRAITLSPDNMLLLQPAPQDDSVQLFDLNTRRRHVVRLEVEWRTFYVRLPDGRRVVFSCCQLGERGKAIIGRARPGRLPSAKELLAYWCNGGARMSAATRRRFVREADYVMTAECERDERSLLFASLQTTDSTPERRFNLFEPGVGATAVRERLSRNIRAPDTYYVHGPLQGIYDREFEMVRIGDGALALGSNRDLLVRGARNRSTRLGPLYEWRMPNMLAYVQLLGHNQVAAIDRDINAIRVFDFSTPHPYAVRATEAAHEPDQPDNPVDTMNGRAIQDEDLGDKVDGIFLYSNEAGRIFRRLGAQRGWPSAYFLNNGDVRAWIAPHVLTFTPHDRNAAVATARQELSAHCRDFSGDAYRASSCWPARYAE